MSRLSALFIVLFLAILAFQNADPINRAGWQTPSPVFSKKLAEADSLAGKSQLDSAIAAFQKIQAQAAEAKDFAALMTASTDVARLLSKKGSNEKGLNELAKALDAFEKNGQTFSNEAAWAHCWAGLINNRKRNILEARKNYKAAIAIFEQNGTLGNRPVFALKNLSEICIKQLDYPSAFRLLDQAIRLDTAKYYEAYTRYNLAAAHFHSHNFSEAIKNCELGLAASPDDWDRADLLSIFAECCIETGQLKKATSKLTEARKMAFSNPDLADLRYGLCASTADLFEKKGDARQAEKWFQKALAEAAVYEDMERRERAKLLVKHAEFLTKTDQKDRAIAEYQKAISQIFPNFSDPNVLKSPPASEAYAESFGMTAPARKAALLLEKAEKLADSAQKRAFLQAAAEAFDLAFGCISQLRNGYGDEAAKLYLGDYAHDYLEKALETRRQLFELETKTAVAASANPQSAIANPQSFFNLLEANRAVVLGEAIRKNRSLESVGLPDSLREREADFRRRLADFRGEKTSTETDSTRAVLSEKIANLEREQRLFLENMDQKWPELRRLREAPALPNLVEMQQKLGPDAAFLTFFEGSEGLFVFALEGKNEPIIRRFSMAEIEPELEEFARFFAEKSRIDAAPVRFFELSNRLFQRLIPFPKMPKRLVVVPDGVVGFVPFDALLTDGNWKNGFAAAPFLVKKTAIEQAWSAAIWATPNSKNEVLGGGRLQFAPLFGNHERGLLPLFFSQNEVEKADFKTILGQKASASAFFEKAKKPLAALHLSTHATATGDPRLEFFDRSASLSEIYGATIPADLVVLSACETGIGQREKSEGLSSFARAFAYAGARSLVASLWSVNDRSTARLFSLFYEKLGNEKSTPSEALRAAKLDFLVDGTSLDVQKSPYYWAGFVPTGEQFLMKKPESPWPFWLLLASGAVAGFAFFLRKSYLKKKGKTSAVARFAFFFDCGCSKIKHKLPLSTNKHGA